MISYIKLYSLVFYFLIAILVSWLGIALIVGIDNFLRQGEIAQDAVPLLFVAMCAGPTTAGLLMIYITQQKIGMHDLISRLRNWKISMKWYLLALLLAPFMMSLTYFFLSLFSIEITPSILVTEDARFLVLSSLLGGFVAGFFEELGWTGFAVPKMLERRNLLETGIMVGIIWGLWHLPLFMSPDPTGEVPFLVLIVVKLFSVLVVYRMVMVWVYHRTESLFIVILMHMSLTASTLLFQPIEGSGLAIMAFNLTLFIIMLAIMLIFSYVFPWETDV